jgi:hypothetical protein
MCGENCNSDGFRDKPQCIRLRALDPAHALLPGAGDADIILDAGSFASLPTAASRVFITENEINYLAFPPVQDSLLIFGAGNDEGKGITSRNDRLAASNAVFQSLHICNSLDDPSLV